MAYPDDMYAPVPAMAADPMAPAVPSFGMGDWNDELEQKFLAEMAASQAPQPAAPVMDIDEVSVEDAPGTMAIDEVDVQPYTGQPQPLTAVETQPGFGVPAHIFEDAALSVPAAFREPGDHSLEKPVDVDQEAGKAFARLSPYEQADQEYAFVQKQKEEQRAREAAAAQMDDHAEARNRASKAEAIAAAKTQREQLELDARKLAETPIDPERWWKSRSTGQKIAGFMSAIVGGLVQGRTGSARNSGLDMITAAIDQDVDAQKADMMNRRAEIQRRSGAVSEQFAEAKEDYFEAEKFRHASYERVKNQITTDMSNYDPRGRAAIELGRLYNGISSAQAKHAQAAEDKFWKDQMEALRFAAEMNKAQAEAAKLEAEAAKMRGAGAGGAKKVKPEDVPQAPGYFAARGLVAPPVPMSTKEYKAWQPLKKGTQEITTNESSLSREALERGIPGLKQADGTPFIARGTPESIVSLRAMKSGTQNAIGLIDEALRVRTGWSSNLGNSDERKKLKAIWGQAKLAAKDTYKLGAITESDVPLIEGALGTDDPSSWTDPEAGMMTARRLMQNRLNRELEAAGYDGAPIDIKAPSTRAPDETPEDRAFKRAQNRDIGSITSFRADAENLAPSERAGAAAEEAPADIQAGIPPTLRKQIDQWAIDAQSSDKAKSERARGYLVGLTTEGGNDAVKEAAKLALTTANMPATESVGGPKGSVAQETVPPPVTTTKGR